MGKDVEHGWQPRTRTETQHHVTELANRAVCQYPLDIVLHEGQRCCNHDGDGSNHHDHIG